jgi:hypothetical protein
MAITQANRGDGGAFDRQSGLVRRRVLDNGRAEGQDQAIVQPLEMFT